VAGVVAGAISAAAALAALALREPVEPGPCSFTNNGSLHGHVEVCPKKEMTMETKNKLLCSDLSDGVLAQLLDLPLGEVARQRTEQCWRDLFNLDLRG
jgi:hypothetical protein